MLTCTFLVTELPLTYFHAKDLSQDARLHALLRIAIQNLVNVHTLRIISGHWMLTNALVAGFLRYDRPRRVPLRKLWLESSFLSVSPEQFLLPGQANELEYIRVRRLASESLETLQERGMNRDGYKFQRGGHHHWIHNGSGGWLQTTVDRAHVDLPPVMTEQSHYDRCASLDASMWENLPEICDFVDANQIEVDNVLETTPSAEPLDWLFATSLTTITSLNLDWILWRRSEDDISERSKETLSALSCLRFPHLRAFQVRNAVLPLTQLAEDVFLLEDTFLEFMESHPKIQCLGWPLDRFYRHIKPVPGVQNRSRKLVAHLAMMLTDLRIDTQYDRFGEPLTDESTMSHKGRERIQRRRFIAEFAPHMRKLAQVKLEGGIPRDEKREILRALHWCSLRKIVMIGVSFPAGNTWGSQGHQLRDLDPGQNSASIDNLEDEDLAGILASYRFALPAQKHFVFEPDYGWPAQAPLLQTIALHHARTIEELKICGHDGCPILTYQTAITNPLLGSLRLYDNLKQLVISFWLLTWFESSHRDAQIIQSWIDTRSPASTALTIVAPPISPSPDLPVDPGQFPNFNIPRVVPRTQDFNRWAVALKTLYSPSALAYRVAHDIGPFLSPIAKERPGGVRVRASFCLGAKEADRSANDIFDLDMRIGGENQVLEFVGPREESEKGRQWDKLEERRWF